jgi:uncharacterized protein (TIGR02001 family)
MKMKILCVLVLGSLCSVPAIGLAELSTDKTLSKHNIKVESTLSTPANALSISPSDAINPLTASFDITSNYVYRGISQTSNLPAVQGGFTYNFLNTGVYFNAWGSNVNLDDVYGNKATVELDAILGVTNKITDNLNYDIKFERYNYPRTASSYGELICNLNYYFLTTQIGYSSNVFNSHATGTYYGLGAKYDIPAEYIFGFNNINISGGIGHYSLPIKAGYKSYDDYNIQVNKVWGHYVFSMQWTDTNGRSVDARALSNSKLIGMLTVNL